IVIQTFPPRRMCLVIAIRAASICRLVTYECSTAWMPYSPKVTLVPPLAAPDRSGRCCLRCLVLRGMSMSSALLTRCRRRGSRCLSGPAARLLLPGLRLLGCPAAAIRAVRRAWPPAAPRRRRRWPVPAARALSGPQARCRGLPLGARRRGVAAVDPDLHADPAKGSARLVEPVVDVRPQRVQRHPALAVELRARHLGAAEATGALHPDALGSALHGGLHRLAHGPPERDPAGQLLGDALGDELSVDLGVLHLEYVQLDPAPGQLLQVAPDPVRLGAAPADDNSRPGGVDPHLDLVLVLALDLHLGNAGALHAALQHPADGNVFRDVVLVQLVGEPPALEVGGDTQPEPVRVHFLAH